MVKPVEQPYPGQSDGQSHELSRNAAVGKGMQTTVDSKATSDPYYNTSSSAYNVQGNRAKSDASSIPSSAASSIGHAQQKIASKRTWVPAGAGLAGFAGTHMILRNLAPTYPLAPYSQLTIYNYFVAYYLCPLNFVFDKL